LSFENPKLIKRCCLIDVISINTVVEHAVRYLLAVLPLVSANHWGTLARMGNIDY
jgi:hypothetical protein